MKQTKVKAVKAWAVVSSYGNIIESGTLNKNYHRLSVFAKKKYAQEMKGIIESWQIIPVMITPIAPKKEKK